MSSVDLGGTMTFTVTGPEACLLKVYGERITEIHQAIEDAIQSGHVETELNSQARYINTGVYIEEDLMPMFKRMYVDEGGWKYLSNRYETARLYLTR